MVPFPKPHAFSVQNVIPGTQGGARCASLPWANLPGTFSAGNRALGLAPKVGCELAREDSALHFQCGKRACCFSHRRCSAGKPRESPGKARAASVALGCECQPPIFLHAESCGLGRAARTEAEVWALPFFAPKVQSRTAQGKLAQRASPWVASANHRCIAR